MQFAGFPGIGMKRLLPKLTQRLHSYKEDATKLEVAKYIPEIPKEETDEITHAYLWPRVGKFFKSNDIIVAETGEYIYA